MTGLFCATKAKNNEEYRKVVKNRMNVSLGISLIGMLTVAVSLLASLWELNISDYMLGFYCGAGSGLTIAGIVLWIKNKRLLSDEEKLKESRLKNSDERLLEINQKAFRIATICLLVALYLGALIGGFLYPILTRFLAIVIPVFLITYLVSYRIYEKRM